MLTFLDTADDVIAVVICDAITGADLDAMLRESIAGSFPQDLKVTGVDVEGDAATATVESESGDGEPEQVRMLDEDGAWKVCETGVGMGAVPQTDQPG